MTISDSILTPAQEAKLFAARDAAREPKSLQWIEAARQFRISCGKYVNKKGKTVEKVFWLGKDELYARCLAVALRRTWAGITTLASFGIREALWSDAELAAVSDEADQDYTLRTGKTLTKDSEPKSPEWVPTLNPAEDKPVIKSVLLTLKDAIDAFKTHLQSTPLSKSRRSRMVDTMNGLERRVDPATRLDDLTYEKLIQIVKIYRDRPLKKDGERMLATSVKTDLQNFKGLLDWLETSEHWLGPRRWEKAFKYKLSDEMTPAEKRAKKQSVQAFSPDEIAKLWCAAQSQLEKSIIMMGLNFAATQMQLAALQFGDDQGDHLHLYRSKTGVEVYYDYWPETQKLIQHWLKVTVRDKSVNPDGLLILSANNKPLVHFSAKDNKTDTADDAWKRILKRTDLPEDRKLGLSALRDTASNVMLKRGGEPIQQQVLAHSGSSVAARHYTAERVRSDFELMNRHLIAWWIEDLAPAIEKAEKETKESVQTGDCEHADAPVATP